MAKRVLAKEQDKFIVRLPDGLRERIKARADLAGVSMNEAVVTVLEREFPEPVTLESRLGRLRSSILFLEGLGADYAVNDLLGGVTELLSEIVAGAAETDETKREQIRRALEKWQAEEKAGRDVES